MIKDNNLDFYKDFITIYRYETIRSKMENFINTF
jgi:hypothetical protein